MPCRANPSISHQTSYQESPRGSSSFQPVKLCRTRDGCKSFAMLPEKAPTSSKMITRSIQNAQIYSQPASSLGRSAVLHAFIEEGHYVRHLPNAGRDSGASARGENRRDPPEPLLPQKTRISQI